MSGDEVLPCWEAAPAAPPAHGLFTELDTPAVQPVLATPAVVSEWTPPLPRPRKSAKPPLEEPRAAAWAEIALGDLTEAPHVEPGPRPMPEVKPGRRRGLR